MKTMEKVLTGKTEEHLVLDRPSGKYVHRDVLEALNDLRSEAAINGFKLEVASSFRSFDAQLRIWNSKAAGERAVLDSQGLRLDPGQLSEQELVYAILRWSALPGASRHHWGSDFDVYDSSAMPEDYRVQLTPDETTGDGIFAEFHSWLDEKLGTHDFYRPYAQDKGGIAPERWHLSYAPLALKFQQELSYDIIESAILESDILLKSTVLKELPEIYSRFINI